MGNFSPLSESQFSTREHVKDSFNKLFEPLLPAFSKGCARVRLESSAAHFDIDAADLEGFARPLWGIVPFVVGGGEFHHWDLYREGIKNGTDPNHEEYWGAPGDMDQRLVELAAIGFAVASVPEHIWDPLDQNTKVNFSRFLVNARNCFFNNNNWKFFRVMIDLGLSKVGVDYDVSMTEEYLKILEGYYLDDGWYSDGQKYRIDYYNPFAFHLYGLIYAKLKPEDAERCKRFRERATSFANQFVHWFADDGSSIPYGRSLTYRFACGSFWGALAFADEAPLPWGVIKHFYLQHLRWWARQPISRLNDGRLTVGYAYPNQFMCEGYNSAQSPYWCMKAFLPLALPETHPFWSSQEIPVKRESMAILKVPGMVITHQPGNTVALVSGPHNTTSIRFQAEKYAKFAYSSRYGFSVELDERVFSSAALDSMLGLSDNGRHFRVRESCIQARLFKNILYSLWEPWDDVQVETWLIPAGIWHIRVHRVHTKRQLTSIEGGFAVARADKSADQQNESENSASILAAEDFSGILDLSSPSRSAHIRKALPNTNLMKPKTLIPQLQGIIPAGEVLIACAVLASPNKTEAQEQWKQPPTMPSLEELEKFKADSVSVGCVE